MMNCKEFFSTKELHQIHPELAVRDDTLSGQDYAVFYNADSMTDHEVPEWPIGLELWVGHKHERNVDGKIYDPLRFYFDRRGFTEYLTGDVYGEIASMTEVVTQQLYGGYQLEVMFGKFIEINDSLCRFLVKTPQDVFLSLNDKNLSSNDKSTPMQILIRVKNDLRICAINSIAHESCSYLYRRIQHSADGYQRYEFLVYPLSDDIHSSRANTFPVKNYVQFYSAVYESCVMMAHHNQARQQPQ